jgi:hypothetical protein
MRLLLDNNLSPQLAQTLREAGHNAEHVRDHGLQSAPDARVLQQARDHDQVLVSADTDFGTLLARTGGAAPAAPASSRRHRLGTKLEGSVKGKRFLLGDVEGDDSTSVPATIADRQPSFANRAR